MAREVLVNEKRVLSIDCRQNLDDCPVMQNIKLNKLIYDVVQDTIKVKAFYGAEKEKTFCTICGICAKQRG